MTKKKKDFFFYKLQQRSREITWQIFIIFRLPQLLGFIHSFMTDNFNHKLSRGFEAHYGNFSMRTWEFLLITY